MKNLRFKNLLNLKNLIKIYKNNQLKEKMLSKNINKKQIINKV